MRSLSIQEIFQCPACRTTLGFSLYGSSFKCRTCGKVFHLDNGIWDFIDPKTMTGQNRREIELHQSLADQYESRYKDIFSKIFSRHWNELFLSFLPGGAELVLDCGCGTGALAADLRTRADRVVACDISKSMMRMAQKTIENWPDILWTGCSGERLPFADAVFNAVCYRGALHHMENEIKALSEAWRVLKPGGLLMLSEPNDDALWLRLPRRLVNRRMERFGNHHKAFKSDPWIRKIQGIGFEVEYTRYFSYLTEPLCGMSDLLPFMKYIPFPEAAARGLIRLDEALSRVPGIRRQSVELFVVARKK